MRLRRVALPGHGTGVDLHDGLQVLTFTSRDLLAEFQVFLDSALFADVADRGPGAVSCRFDDGTEWTSTESPGSDRLRRLGIDRNAFLNVASVSPIALEHLSEQNALDHIRERVVGIVDSLGMYGTADSALRVLNNRIADIGRSVSHSKKPLPLAKLRLDALETELSKRRAAEAEMEGLQKRLTQTTRLLAVARDKQRDLGQENANHERRERSRRLVDAQRLQARLDEVTQTCFMYSSVREFPLEQMPEVQRAANAVATARAQVERTRAESAEAERQLAEELAQFEAEGAPKVVEISDATEQELQTYDATFVRLKGRAEELALELAKARERLSQAQGELQKLPDFSQIGADPVAWMTQLAMSFRAARQSRNASIDKLKRMRAEVERRRKAVAGPAAIFGRFTNFSEEALQYEMDVRASTEKSAEMSAQIDSLHASLDELSDAAPRYVWHCVFFAVVSVICSVAAWWQDISAIFIPAGLSLLFALVSLARWASARAESKRQDAELIELERELDHGSPEASERRTRMETIIREACYTSLRELEALYERYMHEAQALVGLETGERTLTRETQEEIEQVAQLFGRLRSTFDKVGENVEHEDDIPTAASRAMSRYQEYRDAKRRLSETRNRPAALQQQYDATLAELEECQRAEIAGALDVRRVLRDAGFREESRFTNALAALQAYQVRTAQVRERLTRIAALRERCHEMKSRLDEEERDFAAQHDSLSKRLASASAESVEHWEELSKQAKAYRDAREERIKLQDRLAATLQGESIDSLRRLAESEGPGVGVPTRGRDEVMMELELCRKEIDRLAPEELELRTAIADRSRGQRAINEIEEELGHVRARVAVLEDELEATAFAAAMIEEAARERHARAAVMLAESASEHVKRLIGDAAYEVFVTKDLRIAPRHAEGYGQSRKAPQSRILDHVYLALRLALLEFLNGTGELWPLILVETAMDRDENEIKNLLVALREFSEKRQVLVLTSRPEFAGIALTNRIPVASIAPVQSV